MIHTRAVRYGAVQSEADALGSGCFHPSYDIHIHVLTCTFATKERLWASTRTRSNIAVLVRKAYA